MTDREKVCHRSNTPLLVLGFVASTQLQERRAAMQCRRHRTIIEELI